MADLTVTLQLRELTEGGFEATSEEVPNLFATGASAGEALENARKMIAKFHDVGKNGTKEEDRLERAKGGKGGGGWQADDSHDELLFRQYMILDHVDQYEDLSQRRLARLMGMNLSTINQILKRLVRKGFVKTSRINGRRIAYYLTPKGFTEKMRLVLNYTRSTISFFSTVRQVISNELDRLKRESGVKTVAIVGTGELAEAAYLSAQERGLEVRRFYDKEKAGETWLGHVVSWPFSEDDCPADAVIRADMSQDIAVNSRTNPSGERLGSGPGARPDSRDEADDFKEVDHDDEGEGSPATAVDISASGRSLLVVDLALLLSLQMGRFARTIEGE